MHRRLLAALMTLCLLLPASGCGGSGAQPWSWAPW